LQTGCKAPGLPGKKVKGIQEVNMTTAKDIKSLENQLHLLEERIKEVEKRLPAHSVKPPIMVALLELEDERDKILSKLVALKQQSDLWL
jgi:hypothetical protein